MNIKSEKHSKKSPKKSKKKKKEAGFLSFKQEASSFEDETLPKDSLNIEGIIDSLASDDNISRHSKKSHVFSPTMTSTQMSPQHRRLDRTVLGLSHSMSSSESDLEDNQETESVKRVTLNVGTRPSSISASRSSLGTSYHEEPEMSDGSNDSEVAEQRSRSTSTSSYKPPFNSFEVDFKKKNTVWFEDATDPNKELWIMSVPHNFNCCELIEKPVLFGGSVAVKTETDENDPDLKYCWEIHAKKEDSQNGKIVVLLPSKRDKMLHPAGAVHGEMYVTKSMQLTPYNISNIPTKKGREIPEGLKVRNIPFGSGHPVENFPKKNKKAKKRKNTEKDGESFQQEDLVDSIDAGSSTKKKKKKKHKNADTGSEDADLNVKKKKKKHKH